MKKRGIGRVFWFQWVFFMTAFIALSYTGIDIVERPVVTRMVSDPWAREAFMISGLALLGGLVGIGQWFLLRPYIDRAGRWGLAIAATYWVGSSLTEIASASGMGLIPSFTISFLLLGPICGILQWNLLRTQVNRAGWWVSTQTIGWLVLFAVTVLTAYGAASIIGGSVDNYLPVSYALGGAALGATTGAVLVWLLRKPAVSSSKETAGLFPDPAHRGYASRPPDG